MGEALKALEGLDPEATAGDVARLLGGTTQVSPALLALMEALRAQAGGLGAVTAAVDGFGGFEQEYQQIEKVSAHHGDNWEVLLYGHLQRDRALMFELTDKLELTATSEGSRVLDALAHSKRYRTSRDYIPALDDQGSPVDTSFATQNWQKIIRDRSRSGSSCAGHFEAMVFCNLADELRTGDVAVAGSEEYADWNAQLLSWQETEARLPAYLAEVGLREEGDESPFGAAEFRAQLETMLTAGRLRVPGKRGPVHRSCHRGPDAEPAQARRPARLGQAAGAGDPLADAGALTAGDHRAHRVLGRVVAPLRADVRQRPQAQGSLRPVRHHDLRRRHQHGPYEAARNIPGVSGHELSATANRHFSIARLNEAITDLASWMCTRVRAEP